MWALTSGEASNWFPVTRLSHLVDGQLFGADSGWHHLTSVLVHSAATLLLFAFLQRATRARWRSALVAFLFALHPLHVESVAWVAERKDVLSALFWFLTLWTYVRYVERPGFKRYLLVVLPFCLGLMTKPMIVTLPFALLLLDVWPLRRKQTSRLLWEKIPLVALSAAVAVVAYLAQKSAGSVEMVHVPFGMRAENALIAYTVYIAKMFWPAGLAVLYPYPPAIPAWHAVVAALAIAGISVLALRSSRDHPYLTVGWLWYLGTLVPVIGLVQVGLQSRADRYMYIPMTGLSIMLAWGAADLIRRWPRTRVSVISTVAAGCALAMVSTGIQIQYWKDSESLYRRAIAVTDGNYTMHYGLAFHLARIPGRLPEAISEYQAALQSKPDYLEAESNLAGALLEPPGRLPEAIEHYERALRIKPDSAGVRNNLGAALGRVPGRLPEAITQYEAALRIQPDFVEARNNLADALRATPGGIPKAIDQYRALLQIHPNSAETHNKLGAVLSKMPGRLPEALSEYEFALRIKPDSIEAHNGLGALLSEMPGRLQEGIQHYEAALRIDPSSAETHNNLGAALSRVPGHTPEVISQYEAALKIKPDFMEVHYNLGVVLANIPGRLPDAITHFEAVQRIKPDPFVRQMLDRLRMMAGTRG